MQIYWWSLQVMLQKVILQNKKGLKLSKFWLRNVCRKTWIKLISWVWRDCSPSEEMVHRFVHCWSGYGTACPPPHSSDATHAEGAEKFNCESQSPLNSASSHFCLQFSWWILDSVHWAIPARVILGGKYDWLIRCSPNWSFDISIFGLRWNHLMANSAFQHFVVDQSVTAARMLTVSLKTVQVF